MIRYVYVLGLAHSGSTLLGFLLNAHPHAASPGEVALVPSVVGRGMTEGTGRCSCGKPYAKCHRWRGTLARMAAAGQGLGPLWTERRRRRGETNRRLRAFADGFLAEAGADVFVDTSKHPEHLASIAGSSAFDMHVVDLRRDGRGVLHSWSPNNTHLSPERLVEIWKDSERKRDDALARLRDVPVHRVSYEHLASDPGTAMTRLFDALGLDAAEADLIRYGSVEHHIVGNPMRLAAGKPIQLDERWRDEMDDDLRRAFDEGGGPAINSRSGYA